MGRGGRGLPGAGSLGRVNDLLTQLPALLGVLVGTVGTILATSLADRARWRRSQSVRWDERRLDAYVDYAHALKESHAVALRLTADHRPGSRSHPIDREEGLVRLAEADARRAIVWENLLLLGDEPTVAAAASWRDAIWQVERLARGIVEATIGRGGTADPRRRGPRRLLPGGPAQSRGTRGVGGAVRGAAAGVGRPVHREAGGARQLSAVVPEGCPGGRGSTTIVRCGVAGGSGDRWASWPRWRRAARHGSGYGTTSRRSTGPGASSPGSSPSTSCWISSSAPERRVSPRPPPTGAPPPTNSWS